MLFAVTPPSEPPIFEIPPSVTVMVNEPIFIQIAASRPETGETRGLEVFVDNLPSSANFGRGRLEGDRWIFAPEDFGEVELEVPPDFSGRLVLEITAVADGASRRRSLVVDIQSTENTTTVETTMVTGRTPTAETPAVTRETPTVTRETPAMTGSGETPTTPAMTGETPTITRETPAMTGSGETPTTPAMTGKATENTGETPTVTGEAPTVTGKIPTITRDTPATPAMTEETQEMTGAARTIPNDGKNDHSMSSISLEPMQALCMRGKDSLVAYTLLAHAPNFPRYLGIPYPR